MLTIGQLARHTGVPAKTVRFYHSIGLLAEPARDTSGYRRYTAADAIALLKARALAQAGIPLAQIPALLAGTPQERAEAVERIERGLDLQIERLRETRRRLRTVGGPNNPLPPRVPEYLDLLEQIGMSPEWIEMERDLWILAFATHPESAAALLADQHQAKTLPEVQQAYRHYERVRYLEPSDPRIQELADRILNLTRDRYAEAPPPAPPADSPVPQLIQDMINSTSPAWKRLDRYLRAGLARAQQHDP